mgnify:CR=1 FL=1
MTFLSGFSIGLSLILAIGAQNAFVLKQGLLRKHVFLVCLICALSDAILITLGVMGFGEIVLAYPWIELFSKYAGAFFLISYGLISLYSSAKNTHNLLPSKDSKDSISSTVITCLAFTWLNPHVYLDTVIMLGSISTQFSEAHLFGLGAITASFAFFFSLGFGASKLTSYFEKPRTWQILEVCIGVTMIILGINLLI